MFDPPGAMITDAPLRLFSGGANTVGLGASSGPSPAGADPVAAASGSPAPSKEPRGNGFGHGGFGPLRPFRAFIGNGKPDELPGRALGKITITGIDGSNLTLGTEDGWTRTITLGGSTTITRGGAPATASDLHVGDAIRFRQHREANGTFTITAIDVVLPEVVGTITNVDGNTVTVLGRDGTSVTVHLAADTKLQVRGVEHATAKDLARGQIALVAGEKRADGSLDATRVIAGTLRAPKPDKLTGPKDPGARPSSAPGASGQAG